MMAREVTYTTVRTYLRDLEHDGLIEKRDGKIMIKNSQWQPPDPVNQ
jgi:hypothetical protein